MQANTIRQTRKPVEDIMNFQHERLLRRYSLDFGVPLHESERCFEALKQFMIVCAVKPGYKVTSEPIDRMWHTFLLFTKDYRNFCEDNLGIFINHEPFETPSPEAYLETRSFAKAFFGRLDEDLWSVNAKADCSSGCGE